MTVSFCRSYSLEKRPIRIQVRTWKLVLGPSGEPTTNQALNDAAFPLTHPRWDNNMTEGRGSLLVYCQTVSRSQSSCSMACKSE